MKVNVSNPMERPIQAGDMVKMHDYVYLIHGGIDTLGYQVISLDGMVYYGKNHSLEDIQELKKKDGFKAHYSKIDYEIDLKPREVN